MSATKTIVLEYLDELKVEVVFALIFADIAYHSLDLILFFGLFLNQFNLSISSFSLGIFVKLHVSRADFRRLQWQKQMS